MKPRRTPTSNVVYQLPGGNEDNDLWVERGKGDLGVTTLTSVWEISAEERELIAAGWTIELTVLGSGHPPVSLRVGRPLDERRRSS